MKIVSPHGPQKGNMLKKQKRATIDAQNFQKVKKLFELGFKGSEIARHLKMGSSTVSVIKKCQSFNDYHQYMVNRALAYKSKTKNHFKGANKPEVISYRSNGHKVSKDQLEKRILRLEQKMKTIFALNPKFG